MDSRFAIGVLALALIVVAFSLGAQPAPVGGPEGPDLLDSATATRDLPALARAFPARRAGSTGDAALADRVEADLRRAVPAASITVDRFTTDTPDGERDLENVSATLPGQPGPELVVVAHRDALARGATAEMSGTAGLLAIARSIGRGRLRHTLRLVSTSGGSGGGLGGATRLARSLGDDVSGVIVLGDLAGPRSRPPHLVPWSNGGSGIPLRLQRTLEQRLVAEGIRPAPSAGLWRQLVRRGLPATTGEQGEVDQAGVPAVLVSGSGEHPPAADAPVDATRYENTLRGVLRSIQTLDADGAPRTAERTDLVVFGQLLPSWALRVLLLCAVVPAVAGAALMLAAGIGDPRRLATAGGWILGCVGGPLVAGLLAVALGRTGAVTPAVPAPFSGAAIAPGLGSQAVALLLLLVAVAVSVVAAPLLARDAGAGRMRPTPFTVAIAAFAVLAVLELALIVTDPFVAVLLVPALVAWPLAVFPVRFLRLPARIALLVAGAVLPLAAVATIMGDLEVPLLDVPWWFVLAAAGGQIGALGLAATSVVVGVLVACAAVVLPAGRAAAAQRRGADEDDDGRGADGSRPGRPGRPGPGPSEREPDADVVW